MTKDEFVKTIKENVYDTAVSSTLAKSISPPGRKPHAKLKEYSEWYAGQSEQDRDHIKLAIKLSAYSAVFGFLAVLDGVRTIDQGADHGFLELWFIKQNQKWQLNEDVGDYLHDLFTVVLDDVHQ